MNCYDRLFGKVIRLYATLIYVACAVLAVTAFLPLTNVDWWWVRIGDFPRLQLLITYVLAVLFLEVPIKPGQAPSQVQNSMRFVLGPGATPGFLRRS